MTGTLETSDREAAAGLLRDRGHWPIRVDPGSRLRAILDTEVTPAGALSGRERIVFARSLATLTGAGLPLDRALALTRDLGESRAVRSVAGRLLTAVVGGAQFAEALNREAAAFPASFRSAVRAGEAGARLTETLARLASAEEAAAKRRAALRAALIYPTFLLVTAIGAVALLLGYVVPSIEPLLQGVEPPPLTRAIVAAGHFVNEWWLFVLLLSACGVVAFRLTLSLSSNVTRAWHGILLRVPIIGPLWRKGETARFARILGELLENGVALPAALGLVRDTLGNALFQAEVSRVLTAVEAGEGLARPLAQGGLLPPLARQLLLVGEESGQLKEMLLNAAAILEDETARGIEAALAVLTPTLTLLMGLVIALIVASILFALLSLNELAG
ncbi:MAG: type II secretion system F family protein [Pseudomonadota bacterium]